MTKSRTLAEVTPAPNPETARRLLALLSRPASSAAEAASTG